MKTMIMGLAVALAIGGAGCGKKGASECKSWVEKSLQCDDDTKGMSDDEKSAGKELIQGMCEEAMSGKDPGGEGEAHDLAVQMIDGIKKEVPCGQKATCEEFKACEEAAKK